MALLLLTNTFGVSATVINGAVQAGSSNTNLVAGPRSKLTTGTNGTTWAMSYEAGSQEVSHCVVTNMDLFKNSLYGDDIEVTYGSGATVDSTTAKASLSLVGPNAQDWVKPIARTSTEFGINFNYTTASNTVTGKIFFSKSFDFGTAPQLVSLEDEIGKVRPLLGHRQYATERVLQLTWANVSQATMATFRALPLQVPFFIYDESGDLFSHKLEHVVIADPWTETRRMDGQYSLSLVLRRLTQYTI